MRKSYVLDPENFKAEFTRCCQEYNALKIAVAWCGNPNQIWPYKFLENFTGDLKAIVGIAFNHTHPDAIEWFLDIGADISVFTDDAGLFHPKIYLFRNQQRYALFIGSSNLTYGGFYANYETNCLIEGLESPKKANDIALLEETLAKWHTQAFSFKPTKRWLQDYRERYEAIALKQRKQGLRTPPRSEEEISSRGLHPEYERPRVKVSGKNTLPNEASLRVHSRKDLRSILENAPRCFVCNTNRRWSPEAEKSMFRKGYAAAWEDFRFPSHMERAEPNDVILMFAKGAGIVRIGRAMAKCEILNSSAKNRILSGNEIDSREWRIPVDWLAWVEDDVDACPCTIPNVSFVDVSGENYRQLREAVSKHFMR
jgi:hypothetical protein